jgi:hypothetical protein
MRQLGQIAPKVNSGLPFVNIISSDDPKLAPIEDDQNAVALIRKRDKAHRDFVARNRALSAAGVLPMPSRAHLGARSATNSLCL